MTHAAAGSTNRRVVMVAACPFPQPRGTPTRIFRMSEALARRGVEVHVVTTHLGEPVGELPFALHRSLRVPTYHRTVAGPTYQKLLVVDPLLSWKLLRVVRSVSPDVIHAHHYEGLAAALPVRALTGVPVVYDAHTLLATELSYYGLGLSERMKRWLGARIDRALPRRADAAIAVSPEIASVLEGATRPGAAVRVVSGGVEPEMLRRSAEPPPADASKRLVYAGGFAAYQGTDLMLEAFARVLEQRPEVRLTVVASESTERIRAEVERAGLKESVDWVESGFAGLRAALEAAQIALHPRIECSGLPQKLLNYLAAGRAVVSFAGSAPQLEDGVTARIVPDGDVEGFARAVIELVDDPAEARRLGERGHQLARESFSWERSAEQVEDLYAALLENGERRG